METSVGAGKRGKTRDYPALSSLRRLKKSRDYVDYDYVSKLSSAEKAWLNQFTDEYYNANAYRFETPMLERREMERKSYVARNDVMNVFDRCHGREPAVGGLEDALVEALDQDRPAIGIRAFPGPATAGSSGLPGLEDPVHRPAIESGRAPTPRVDGPGLTNPPYLSVDWSIEVSKTSHQKKRVATKQAKLVVAAAPTGSQAGDMFRQTVNLLKCGLFDGANARAVAQAIELMEQSALAADAGPRVAPEEAPADGQST